LKEVISMGKKTIKYAVLAAMMGTMFGFGGCLNFRRLIGDAVTATAVDLVAGNKTLIDSLGLGSLLGGGTTTPPA